MYQADIPILLIVNFTIILKQKKKKKKWNKDGRWQVFERAWETAHKFRFLQISCIFFFIFLAHDLNWPNGSTTPHIISIIRYSFHQQQFCCPHKDIEKKEYRNQSIFDRSIPNYCEERALRDTHRDRTCCRSGPKTKKMLFVYKRKRNIRSRYWPLMTECLLSLECNMVCCCGHIRRRTVRSTKLAIVQHTNQCLYSHV